MRLLRTLAYVTAPAVLAAGCSLVNAFEEVQPLLVTETGGEDGGTDTSVPDTQPPDTGTPETAPVDADSGPVDRGLVVVSATTTAGDAGPTGTNVLAVLDPETGKRVLDVDEKLTVVSVRYDGASDRWYLFVNKRASFDPIPSDEMELQVRTFDREKKAWTTTGSLKIPPMVADETNTVVLNGLAYVSQNPVDGGTPELRLTTIDVRDPKAPKLGGSVVLPTSPIGLVGTRANTGAGGTVNMIFVPSAGCTGGVCGVQLQRAIVPLAFGTPTLNAAKIVANTTELSAGTPTWGTFNNNGSPQDVLAVPPTGAETKATVLRFDPFTNNAATGSTPVTFTPGITTSGVSRRLSGLAVAECQKTALVVDLLGNTLHAVPFAADGTAAPASLGRAGQRVYFEPYTNTVLAPFKAGASVELAGFSLGGTENAPTLTRRPKASWDPPVASDQLQPVVVATKAPLELPCK